MKQLVLFIALLFVFIPQVSYACRCPQQSEEKSREIVNKAFFVGKIKVLSNQDLTDNPNDTSIVELEVVESYKKGSYLNITAVRSLNEGMCGFGAVKVGEVLEVVIYKIEHEKYSYKLKGTCPWLASEVMEEFRQQASKSESTLEIDKPIHASGFTLGDSMQDGSIYAGVVLRTTLSFFTTRENASEPLTWNDAKKYCEGLAVHDKDDWELPDKELLNELYSNKDAIGSGQGEVFNQGVYWSSSEYSEYDGATQSFSDPPHGGYQMGAIKSGKLNTRCVRSELRKSFRR